MNLICINCPRGCDLIVEEINGEVKVEGNLCPRGIAYATSELMNPLRTLTSTVNIDSQNYLRLPVISSQPLPKARIMEAMKQLKDINVSAPIKMGDVVVKNILGLDVDIIASKTIEK